MLDFLIIVFGIYGFYKAIKGDWAVNDNRHSGISY